MRVAGHAMGVVVSAATARVEGALVEDSSALGVGVAGAGGRVEVVGSVVRRTRGVPGRPGLGLEAEGGGALQATRVLVTESAGVGAHAMEPGTVLRVTDSVVSDTRTLTGGQFGYGLEAEGGGTLQAERVRVTGSTGVGCGAKGAGSVLELARCAVRGTRWVPGRSTSGLGATRGAVLRATDTWVSESAGAGLVAVDEGTRADLSGCVVTGVSPVPAGTEDGAPRLYGRGLEADDGAELSVRGTLVTGVSELGVMAWGEGTRVTLRDALVLGVSPSARGFGFGLGITAGATVDATRVAVQSVSGAGAAALPFEGFSGASLTASGLFVRGVGSSPSRFVAATPTEPSGPGVAYGLHAATGCTVRATYAVLDEGGWGFFHAAGVLDLRHARITGQQQGAGASNGASTERAVTLEDVSVGGNASDAIQRDLALPEALLPPPPRPCALPPCS